MKYEAVFVCYYSRNPWGNSLSILLTSINLLNSQLSSRQSRNIKVFAGEINKSSILSILFLRIFRRLELQLCQELLKNKLFSGFSELSLEQLQNYNLAKQPKMMPKLVRSFYFKYPVVWGFILQFYRVWRSPPFQISTYHPIVNNLFHTNTMDIWSFKTQGINYEKYRPEYPIELRSDALEPLQKQQNYLDIAVGTGKILLSFCQHFKSTKGIDISQQMLSVSQIGVDRFKHLHPQRSVVLEKNSITDLSSAQKYDLITCGQALHFFTGLKTYQKIKEMLNEGGMFMVFGYVLREVHSQDPMENSYFYEFYDQMLPYFTFDMYELHNHYTKEERYPFTKVFDKVDRKQNDLVVQWSREQYINYLKTWSAYNLYVTKHGVDPITSLESKGSQKVTCVFDYFRVRCYK